MIVYFIKLLRGKKADVSELWSNYAKFFHYLGAGILFGLMVLLGSILLIIPGIYLALRFQFFGELILDKDMGIMDSLSGSWKLTKGFAFDLFVLALVSFVVTILGVLALLVGVLVAAPVVYAGRLAAYNFLLKENKV